MWVSDPLRQLPAYTAHAYKHKCERERGAIIAWFTSQAHFHMQV